MASPKATPVIDETPVPEKVHHRVQEDSTMRRLMRVAVGDTVSNAERFDADTTFAQVQGVKTKMSNVISGQISKVRQKLDHSDKTFTYTVGHFNSSNGDVIVTCAVTRLS